MLQSAGVGDGPVLSMMLSITIPMIGLIDALMKFQTEYEERESKQPGAKKAAHNKAKAMAKKPGLEPKTPPSPGKVAAVGTSPSSAKEACPSMVAADAGALPSTAAGSCATPEEEVAGVPPCTAAGSCTALEGEGPTGEGGVLAWRPGFFAMAFALLHAAIAPGCCAFA